MTSSPPQSSPAKPLGDKIKASTSGLIGWMRENGTHLTPWLLMGNLLLLLYLVSVTRDARDGAWSAEESASNASAQADAAESQASEVSDKVDNLDSDVSSLQIEVSTLRR